MRGEVLTNGDHFHFALPIIKNLMCLKADLQKH